MREKGLRPSSRDERGASSRHVTPVILFDADGVLQHTPFDWIESLRALCPDPLRASDFVAAVFAAEGPALRGERAFEPDLRVVMREFDCESTVTEALDLWRQLHVDEAVITLAAELKEAGYCVAVASNQQSVRAAYMRSLASIRRVFDTLLFSGELGARKPDPSFFERCAQAVGARAIDCVFVDDAAANVDSARACGMQAFRFDGDLIALRSWLREAVGDRPQ